MPSELDRTTVTQVSTLAPQPLLPTLIEHAGPAAQFIWDEFFYAEHHNPHTRAAYFRAVRRFLTWAEGQGMLLPQITPGKVGQYMASLGGSAAKRNLHLSALRGFFDRLVHRHVVVLNPATSVKGVRETALEGKTPEIGVEQARALLKSLDVSHMIGLRDRAIIATLIYTACRAGAVAKLRLGDFRNNGEHYTLRFLEKGSKSREIPVRLDLEGFIRAYLDAAGIASEPKDWPLFRASKGRARHLGDRPLSSKTICDLVKRRLADAGLPTRLSPHSFRVAAITNLLTQGVPLEEVQYLAGHAEPRTTSLYDRRRKSVSRNIVERISI